MRNILGQLRKIRLPEENPLVSAAAAAFAYMALATSYILVSGRSPPPWPGPWNNSRRSSRPRASCSCW